MSKFHFEETDEPLDIRYDGVFKAVFTKTTQASNKALSELISALIGREVSVAGIDTNEPPIDNLDDRQIRFDINCKTENGDMINVEMTFNPSNFEPARLEFYAGKLFTRQDVQGKGRRYKDLKEAYQITILGNKKIFPDDVFLHTFEYYDPVHNISLKGKSRIITLELAKVEKVVEKPVREMNKYEMWAIFFQYLTDRNKRNKINEILEMNEGIAMAKEVLITITRDDIEWARQMSKLKYELDTQDALANAEYEGIEKGIKTTARNALAKGLPLETIRDITGLDLETIRNLGAET